MLSPLGERGPVNSENADEVSRRKRRKTRKRKKNQKEKRDEQRGPFFPPNLLNVLIDLQEDVG